jgi:hypothetical protein
MIDNIRFNFRFKPKEDWFDQLENNSSFKKIWSSGICKALKGKLFLDENVKKKENGKPKPSLLIEILFLENKEVKVVVSNSLRKWFFDASNTRDFNKFQFEECLNLISEKLNISEDILLGSKVTKAEYGANLSFREEYRCYYACIGSHYDLKKKCIYGDETIEFKGENRSVIFYDKVAEQKGKTFKAKNQKKLNAVTLLLRYEIKIEKMSGAPEKPLMSYLHDILKNWDLIADLWYEELDKITFVNNMNPKVYSYLKDVKIKPIKDYLIYLGIRNLGSENLRLILSDRIYAKIRKSTSDSLDKIYEEFNSMVQEEDFEKLFRVKVQEKVEKLKA